jgi:AcrR family transcriptional regulator
MKSLKGKTDLSKSDTKNILIKTAILLLEKKGVHALSLREVARKAKLSNMAPYRHFNNKEDLISAICIKGFNSLTEKFLVAERKNLDPKKRFKAMAEAYLDFAITHPQECKLMFGGFIESPELEKYPDLKIAGDQCFDRLLQMIEYCQHHKYIKKGNLQPTAYTIWSMVHGFSMLWLERGFEKDNSTQDEQMKQEMLDFICHSIINGLKS